MGPPGAGLSQGAIPVLLVPDINHPDCRKLNPYRQSPCHVKRCMLGQTQRDQLPKLVLRASTVCAT